MKKFAAVILVFALVLSLTACASAEFKSATELVGALAETEITVDSAETVAAARAAYDLLTEDEKAKFELYDTLTAAEEALAEAEAEAAAYAEFLSNVESYLKYVVDGCTALQSRHVWFEKMWNNAIQGYGDGLTGFNMYNLTSNAGMWKSMAEIEDFCEYAGMGVEEVLVPMVLIYEPSMLGSEVSLEELKSIVEPYFPEAAAAFEDNQTANNCYVTAGLCYSLFADYAEQFPEECEALAALNGAFTAYYNIAGADMTGVDNLDTYLTLRSDYEADLDAAMTAVEAIVNG